jgi:hypothetical protein
MKRFTIIIGALLLLCASPFSRAVAASQPLTDEQISAIRIGCNDALRSVAQVQKTEAGARVNRGREYETMLHLVASLNSRIALNKLDAPIMTSSAAKLQTTFTQFQQHYIDYANKMDATIAINCNDAPVSFYDSLNEARGARAIVANDVKQMDTLFDDYQKGLDSLKLTIARLDNAEVNQQ